MNNKEEVNKIDIMAMLGDFLKVAGKFWLPMLLVVAGLTVGSYFLERIQYHPEYQSQATFSVNTDDSSIVGSSRSSSEQVKESLPYILKSDVMKNMVMDELGMDSFPARIEIDSKETINFYTLRVASDNAEKSYEILKSILDNCPKASVYVLGKIKLEVLDESGVISKPVNYQDKGKSLVKGAFTGITLCLIFSFLYILTNHTIQREEDFKKYLSVSCIASVPQIAFKKRRKKFDKHIHIYNDKVGYGFLEAIRTIRTRVSREAERLGAKVILVTSSIPGEGKSTIAANLALSLAEKGRKVVLVDLDLRNPSVETVLGKERHVKYTVVNITKTGNELKDAIQVIKEWNLSVVFGGDAQSDPAKALNSVKIKRMIAQLRESYDYVILDTPPAAMLADASDIARCAECALYVVKQDYARVERIAEGMEALNLANTPIIGVVLNGLEKIIGGYGYGSYRYARYGAYGHYGEYAKTGEDASEYVEVEHEWRNE